MIKHTIHIHKLDGYTPNTTTVCTTCPEYTNTKFNKRKKQKVQLNGSRIHSIGVDIPKIKNSS